MSDKISKYKIQKTIKEYDFLKSEYNYVNEISNIADSEFLKAINEYLKERPALKDIYDSAERKIMDDNIEKINKKSEKITEDDNNMDDESENERQDNNDEQLNKKKSKKSKYLYRQIVKLTHPDKIKDDRLNDIYIRATDCYNEDDAVALYAICDELDIAFGVSEEDLIFFENNIHRIKGEINLIKGTFAYDWSQSTSDKGKELLILKFIKIKIS